MISVYLFVFSIVIILVSLGIVTRTKLRFSFRSKLAGVLATILGVILILLGGSQLEESFAKRSWTPVMGEIVSVEVIGERAKRPLVTYSYKIAEARFQGLSDLDQPSFGGRNQRRSTAEIKASNYSPGDSVQVFVNTVDPNDSTLRPHPFWGEYGRAGFGVFLLAFGVVALLGRRPRELA